MWRVLLRCVLVGLVRQSQAGLSGTGVTAGRIFQLRSIREHKGDTVI